MTIADMTAITAVSIAGAVVTRILSLRPQIGTVRASSVSTLGFLALSSLSGHPAIPTLGAAFFGGTFVGMSAPDRLNMTGLLAASALYAVVFGFALPYADGLGGGLGTSAFVACASIALATRKVRSLIE